MTRIGCHLSVSKGYLAMGREALRIGADTFSFFTRNPRGGGARQPGREDISSLAELLKNENFAPLVAHAPYTYNLCSDKQANRDFAERSMREDLERLEELGGNYYNFHPGNHMKQGAEEAIRIISDSLERVMWSGMKTTVLLETMAGKGTEVGRSFGELAMIIEGVSLKENIGVCLDTCHVYDAGYDIVGDLEGVLGEFDRIIGLRYLKAVHLNDSKNPFSSHKDRHEKIGQGYLGLECFERVINCPALRELPFILETPQEDNDGYRDEISMLRSLSRQRQCLP